MATWFAINRDFIPIKVLYFLFYGGTASFLTFKSVYQRQLGMSTTQNGIIEAVFRAVPVATTPLIGIIADKTKAYKLLFGVLLFLSAAFSIPFYFVPAVDDVSPLNISTCCLHIINDTSRDIVCPENSSYPVDGSIANHDFEDVADGVVFDERLYERCLSLNMSNITSYETSNGNNGRTFVLLVILTALMAACFAPVVPLLDSTAIDKLGKDSIASFGLQRLWGGVGFGLAGMFVGYLTDVISPVEIDGRHAKNYVSAFCGAGVMWCGAIGVMAAFTEVSVPKAERILSGVKTLIVKKEIMFFLFSVLVSGFALGTHSSFVYWYLQDFDDFQLSIIGLGVLESSISEISMFWLSGWICDTLGCVSALSIGLFAFATRFIGYAIISEAWQLLTIEWLQGLSFALPMAAMCTYASTVAPEGAIATLISISHTIFWGIGYTLGALLGGLVYEHYGAKVLFHCISVMCFACAVTYWVCYGQYGICNSRKPFKNASASTVSSGGNINGKHNSGEKERI